jgi:anaerobic carbon-monoxide dehydrogenase, CODH/ACS complex subunit alpha
MRRSMPRNSEIHSSYLKSAKRRCCEKNFCRSGRGAVSDVEIRSVGGPIVLGEIPGIVALVGCANYPNGGKDVYDIAENSLHDDTSL